MLRWILYFVLIFVGRCVLSQPVVLPTQKSLDFSLSKDGDERQYVTIPGNVRMLEEIKGQLKENKTLKGDEKDSIRKFLITSVKNVLDLKFAPELMIAAEICFDKNGEVSHVFYNIKPFFFKNIDQFLQEKLPAEISERKLRLPNARLSIVPLAFYIRVNSTDAARNIPKRDSSLTLIEDLNLSDSLKIKRINLSSLDLLKVPDKIYRFPNLEELDLHDNNISRINIEMERLPKLSKIDLSSNQLDQQNIFISRNRSLKILNLQKNAISDIPATVRASRKLQSLWLGGNVLTRLNSNSFGKLRYLEDLNLYNNALDKLPKGIKKLRRLKIIDLYYNDFEQVPTILFKLKKLEVLAISHNRVSHINPKVTKLRRLRVFYAHHNQLTAFSPKLKKLRSLQKLDLGYNKLALLPAFICHLSKLKELDISYNQLTCFPEGILEIENLKSIFLNGNSFIQRPESSYIQWIERMRMNNTLVYY